MTMTEPSAYAISTLLTDLIGRKVSVAQASTPEETKGKQMFGVYQVVSSCAPIVLKADLVLLVSMAGVLVGLPDSAVKERLAAPALDELIRDAMHELLNILSTVVSVEGRAIFNKMLPNAAYVDGPAGVVLKKPSRRSFFTVEVEGYEGGHLSIFSSLAPTVVG
jgi:hypothetical protein